MENIICVKHIMKIQEEFLYVYVCLFLIWVNDNDNWMFAMDVINKKKKKTKNRY